MFINCDYCGASIDINKYKVCPHCGASYENDQELLSNKKHQEELNQIQLEQQKAKLEEQKIKNKKTEKSIENKKSSSAFRTVFLMLILIFGIGFMYIKISEVNSNKNNYNNYDDNTNYDRDELENNEELEIIETPICVKFNEPAQLTNFKVTITELKEVDKGLWLAPTEGYMYIGFKFEVENTSDKTLTLASEKIYCLADEVLIDEFPYSEEKELQKTDVPAGTKIVGYYCFEAPINTKEFTVKYGDYITIKVNNTLLEN